MADSFARMRQLIGTTAEWAANDLVIGTGELALEIVGPGVNRMKIGNGVNVFSALPYFDPGVGSFVLKAGDTMTGLLTTPAFNVPDGGTATAPTVPTTENSRKLATTAWVRDLLLTRGQGDAIYQYGGTTLGVPAAGKVIIGHGAGVDRTFNISATDADGIARLLTMFQPGDSLIITNEFTPTTAYARYDLTGAVVDHGTWVEFPAHLIDQAGTGETPPLNTRIKLTGYLNLATGDGPILGVTAGDGLTGGGLSGNVTLAIDPAVVAPLASPDFTGDPKAPTAAFADRDTSLATTGHVAISTMKLVSEAVITTPTTFLQVAFPAAAKIVAVEWSLQTVGLVNAAFAVRGLNGATPNSSAKYHASNLLQQVATLVGEFAANTVGWPLHNAAAQTWGKATFQIPSLGFGQADYSTRTAAAVRIRAMGGWETDTTMPAFDGLYFSSTVNLAAGSYVRCFALV